ncbi:MAG: Hsp70 family protein, partial [Anaerolineae bacterium]|nr:Hsp70 family protein [Anaerolineae bacterium]
PEIAVTFRVDSDCILHVTARDVNTGNYKEITITDSVRLSDEEIEKMVREAEEDSQGDTEACDAQPDELVVREQNE